MPRTAFRPQIDGYAFVSSFTYEDQESAKLTEIVRGAVGAVGIVLPPPPVFDPISAAIAAIAQKLTIDKIVQEIVGAVKPRGYGLCGGIAFSALDYFLTGWVVPRGNGWNDQPQRTSQTGEVLRNYLWSRLLKSLEDNAATFVYWMAVLHLQGGSGATWLRDQTRAQLPVLKARIHSGMPVTVGLIGTTLIPTDNHQVLCYGYDDNSDGTTTLYLYDPNAPDVESTTTLDFSGPALSANESAASSNRGPLRGLFCTSYIPQTPPRAVVLRSGLTITPPNAGINQAVTVQFSAANIGFHSSPDLKLVAASGTGTVAQENSMGPIAEAGSRALSSQLGFGAPGTHRVSVMALLTAGGIQTYKQLPPEDGSQSETANVTVFAERKIRLVVQRKSQVPNIQGALAVLTTTTSDMGPGVTYQWSVTGATIEGSSTSPQVQVRLPDQPDATVTVNVRCSVPDGAVSTGTYTFQTVGVGEAALQEAIRDLGHVILGQRFMEVKPLGPDPVPDAVVRFNPGEVAAFRELAANLVNAADTAIQTNVSLKVAPGLQSSLAAKRGLQEMKVSTEMEAAPISADIATPLSKHSVISNCV